MTAAFPAQGHIHIVGIGGAGMSAIARVLLGRGYIVSGSDRQTNPVTESLRQEGAVLYNGHAAENVIGALAVLISSAVPPDNPEITAANAAGLPVFKRRDALGAITDGYNVIAVAGTHGKTTTSALITHLLIATGYDPTYIVGGTLLNTGTNAGVGHSKWFIIEADEYDYMFLGLRPQIAVITNIEHDHPDMFPTLADVRDAFQQFTARLRDGGTLIVDRDDPNAAQIGAHWQADVPNRSVTWFDKLTVSDPAALAGVTVDLKALPPVLSGDHNLRNMAAALFAARKAAPFSALVSALYSFKGTARRMERLGETANGVTLYSDYGHHPTAIRATLQGARSRFPSAQLWAIWQPHTYSRTHLLAREFADSFADADHVLIMDIYAAREQPTPGPTETDIALWATQGSHPDARHTGDLIATAAILRRDAQSGDVVILFSAGDAPRIAEMLLHSESDEHAS